LCRHHRSARFAESRAPIAAHFGEHSRPGELVVGGPRRQLAQLLHDRRLDLARTINHQVGASRAHECSKVVEVHRCMIIIGIDVYARCHHGVVRGAQLSEVGRLTFGQKHLELRRLR